MYQSLKTVSRTPARPDAHVVFVFSGMKQLHASDKAFDKANGGVLAAAMKRPEFNGSAGDASIYTDTKGTRFIVVGLGDEKKFNEKAARKAGGRIVAPLDKMAVDSVHMYVNEKVTKALDADAFGRAFAEGVGLAAFDFSEFKGTVNKKDDDASSRKKSRKLSISTSDSKVTKAMEYGLSLAESTNYARTLAATPPNVATTTYIAKKAQEIARQSKGAITCNVIKGAALEKNNLVGHINVGKASENPPCLIEMKYSSKARTKSKKTIVLVGKTITYDTGGLSLKINNSMRGMKYDKCGGMAVIGAMHAVSWMKPKCNVVAYLAAAENSISDEAYRPDDILEYLNGVTVEVTNTDAEGRLVLADALAYGCKKNKADAIIDLATLTGGIVVAFGRPCAGLWCDDDKLRGSLEDAGNSSGDVVWRMPLLEEHRDMMKAKHADIWNSAPVRDAHPIQGAAFLSYFVDEDLPWAHIDIAGTATLDSPNPPFAAGPTGFGVRLLAYYLENV